MDKQDKPKLDVERKWRHMIPVSHQFYIYARKAAQDLMGDERVDDFVRSFWEISGRDTGRLYLTKGKLNPDDLVGLVKAIDRSAAIMGEETEVRIEGDKVYLIHNHCPWPMDYDDYGLPESCQGGCDVWFQTAAATVSPRFRVRTLKSIPSGGGCCVREFWVETTADAV